MTTARVFCLVPYCKRTKQPSPAAAARIDAGHAYEWICAEHWRQVPKGSRALFFRARRRRRACLEEMMWRRCKTFAIERAMGI